MSAEERGPYVEDLDQLRGLLDLMESFANNDQRARYILSSNWLRDRGAVAAAKIAADIEDYRRERAERERSTYSDPAVRRAIAEVIGERS